MATHEGGPPTFTELPGLSEGIEMGNTLPPFKLVTNASQVVPPPSNRPEGIKKLNRTENRQRKRIHHLFCGRYQELFFLNLMEIKESNKIFCRTVESEGKSRLLWHGSSRQRT
jgi:hypothetical protein